VGLPWAKDFVCRFSPYIDDFIPFPGFPGLPEVTPKIDKIPEFLMQVQKEHFDLAMQMHGSGSFVNPLLALFGARMNAGFYVTGEYCPDRNLFMPYPEHEHEIRRLLRLIDFLGIPLKGEYLEFPIIREDLCDLLAISQARNLKKGEYVCVHPGARMPARRWFPERFAKVADEMADSGFTVVLTGSQDEVELSYAVSQRMQSPHINLAGRTTLGALAALIRDAGLLISNDTGVSHIAAAHNVPSVVITTASDPLRWGPLNYKRHKVIYYPVKCRPCAYARCPIGYLCGEKINSEAVISQAKQLMREETVAGHV
jgi:ADP-heptose:LPS heptosyltransferase